MVLPYKKTHNTERMDSKSNVHSEPLNGLVNTVARFEVSRLNRDQRIYDRVCMEYIDNSAYEITACPEFNYGMWDCCFHSAIFVWGSRPTTKGQQREYSHKRRIAACSAPIGTEVRWISGVQRRARGLIFLF